MNTTQGGNKPNVGGRYAPAAAEGFTIIQRLDWSGDQTIPLTSADQDTFAQQCANNWAKNIKSYCRHYSIGNEVEYFGVTPAIYADCFRKVRNAIKVVQPEARVIIGHMNDSENQRAAIRLLGSDGYDGLTAHTGSGAPTDLCDMLDEENARTGVGVYVTEWGWVADTNPNSYQVMRGFYQEIGQSNASRSRQIYCACWYLYPGFLGQTFSLQLSHIDNPAFEACTALGTAVNSYAASPVVMSSLYADVADSGMAVTVSWQTDWPARTQLWWTPWGTSGSGREGFIGLIASPSTSHQASANGLIAGSAYEVLPTSTADDRADAGGRRFRVKTGPWVSTVTRLGGDSVRIDWSTDWPANSSVEYGLGSVLAYSLADPALVTQHSMVLTGLADADYSYRILSGEPNPDGGAGLVMRSPIRTFTVGVRIAGDFDGDKDVDQSDFGHLQLCLTGSGVPPNDPSCDDADLDADQDVDQTDVGMFLRCLSGPGQPVSPNCL